MVLVAGLLLAGLNLAEAGPGEVGGPGCAVMVVVLLLGGVVGHYVGFRSRDARMVPAWEIEAERPAGLQGKGMWMSGGTAVRVRSDGAVAYGPDGRVRWRYRLQDSQVVCMMSPNAGGGVSVGLIGYAVEGEPCRKPVWSAPVPVYRRIGSVTVLSAEPAVVRVLEEGEGGDDRIMAFTGGAQPSGVIPVIGERGRISFDAAAFPLVRTTGVQVRNGMIYALLDKEQDDVMIAYGLNGRPRWSRTWDLGQIDTFSAQNDGIVLIYDGYKGHQDRVTVLDPSSGEDTSSHGFGDNSYYFEASPAWTFRHQDLVLVATPHPGAPLVAYRKDKG